MANVDEAKLSEILIENQKEDYVWTNIMDSYSQADLTNDISDDDYAQKQLHRSMSSEIAGPLPKEGTRLRAKNGYGCGNTFEQMHELTERMSRLVKESEDKHLESQETIEELQNMLTREKLHRETAEGLISELSKEFQTLRTTVMANQKAQNIEALNHEITCLELRKKTIETLSNYPKVDGVGLVDAFDKMLLSVRRCEGLIDQNPEYQQYLNLVNSLIAAQKATIDSQMKEIAVLQQTRLEKEKAKQLATEELAIVNNQIISSRLNTIDTICANIVTIIQSTPTTNIETHSTQIPSKNRLRAGTTNKSLEPAKKWAKGIKSNIVKAANTTIASQLREKSKKTASTDSLTEKANMFGVELASIMKNQEIPFFITSCIETVEAKGLEYEGIYRKSGPMSQINALYYSFNKGEHRSLNNPEDPFDITAVTSILKKFFRDMPDPLIPSKYYKDLIECMSKILFTVELPIGNERDTAIKVLINQIPTENYVVLSYLINHLAKVQLYAEKNLMTASNLGVVFGPTILRNQQTVRSKETGGLTPIPNEELDIPTDPGTKLTAYFSNIEENKSNENLYMQVHSELEKSILNPINSEEDHRQKLYNGLLRIKEYDMQLKQKSLAARSLKKERLERESLTGTPVSLMSEPSYHNILSDEEDDEEFELKSLNSEDLITFLTEPKFKRVSIGKEALLAAGTKPKPKQKATSYKQGDFIGRNIALGGDARYYHAMTEEEMKRVDTLLALEENKDEQLESRYDRIIKTSAFTPELPELEKLNEIEGKLRKLTPQSTLESDFLWTPEGTSGRRTPTLISTSAHSKLIRTRSEKELETIIMDTGISNSTKEIFQNPKRIEEIDQKLNELHSLAEDDILSREEIDSLVFSLTRANTENTTISLETNGLVI
ncbi:Rho GTPase-activating protein 15 [Boothiomyces sp. JEL0866]|nr:Rho GTPase-activating protein 15 [Boothiomyces sp. JEL0866]